MKTAHIHTVGATVMTFLVMLAVNTEASIAFGNSTRSASASNNKGSSQSLVTNGNEKFNETARIDWQEFWADYNYTGKFYSEATQESEIGWSHIHAKGSVRCGSKFYYYGDTLYYQEAKSYFEVNFTITNPSNVILKGSLISSFDLGGTNKSPSQARVFLSKNDVILYSKTAASYTQLYTEVTINEVIQLPEAGQYNLKIDCDISGYWQSYPPMGGVGGGGIASYDVGLIYSPTLEAWRYDNFGTSENTGEAADGADRDHDGKANIDEFTAGTNPNDCNDFFGVLNTLKDATSCALTVDGKLGRTYTLQRNPSLAFDGWTTVANSNPSHNGGPLSLIDTAPPSGHAFYRIKVSKP